MGGDIHHPRIIVKGSLRAVAVVDIEVDDKDAFQFIFFKGVFGGDSDVVKEAKAHSLTGGGVVARGPDQGEGVSHLPTHHRLHRPDNAAGGIERRLVGVRRHHRIGVKPAAATSGFFLNLFDIVPLVDQGYFVNRGGAGFNRGQL
ncbi:hypothetical protein ES708_15992 [subsurface metagenome]